MSGQTPADGGATPSTAVPTATRRVTVTVGNHLGDRRPAALTMSETLVGEVASIAHLARYSTGTCDFALDAEGADAPHAPFGLTADERQIIGRDVVHVMTDLDAYLSPACSGDLIRMLLHTDRGALFTLSVLREQFLVAFTWSAGNPEPLPPREPAVREADVELSRLANRLRESVSQQPTDYGGWLGLSGPVLAAGLRDSHPVSPAAATAPDTTTPDTTGSAATATAAAICRRYLGVDDLHYAAVCRAGRIEAVADILDDPRLEPFFDDITPERRRHFYALVGKRIDVHLRTLVRATHLALGSRVRRLVLDVEQGALYCYPVGLDRYLLGVTLDQHRVWAADDKAALLSRALGG